MGELRPGRQGDDLNPAAVDDLPGRPGAWCLGIHEGHVDPSAALVRDGELIAFAEEERFSRVKHAPGAYPVRAVQACLAQTGIGPDEIDVVAVPWDLDAFTDGRIASFYRQRQQAGHDDAGTVGWQERNLARYHKETQHERHARIWRRHFGLELRAPVLGVPHHLSHAWLACTHAPFEPALCLTLDGSGDTECTSLWLHQGGRLSHLMSIPMPHSLGWVYAALTEYLGFDAYDGEYRVMGLAAWGAPDPELTRRLTELISADGPAYRVDPRFLHQGAHRHSERFSDALIRLLGQPPRSPGASITPWHIALAATLQHTLEQTVERLVRWGVQQTGVTDICLAGGVALNVKLGGHLLTSGAAAQVFTHPLSNDGGAALGAALRLSTGGRAPRRMPLHSVALGPDLSQTEIDQTLDAAGLEFEVCEDPAEVAAEALAQGQIVGWVQGRMEAGPRALGQRSILADPRRVEQRDRLNQAIKRRERWRPFGPALPVEVAQTWLEGCPESPFMTLALPAGNRLQALAPAAVHVDGTTRVQTVDPSVQPLFHRLLQAFGKRTGVPVLLNTSFNLKGEPIVATPMDAVRTFFSTGLDVLILGTSVMRKPRRAPPIPSGAEECI